MRIDQIVKHSVASPHLNGGCTSFPENVLDQRYLRIKFYKLVSDNGIALEQTLGKYEIL